ncbi:MAG: hypothetical protein ACM3UW_07635 [Bacillota bacterium]
MSKKGNEGDKLLTDNELATVAGGIGSPPKTTIWFAQCHTPGCGFTSEECNSQSEAYQVAQQHNNQNPGHNCQVEFM